MTATDPLAQVAPHENECANCHQVDNHLKHHYGDRSFHFDCLPEDVRADSFDHLPAEERQRIATIIAHATADGVEHLHGHDLRVKHVEIDPNLPAGVKRALGLPVPTKGKTRG